MTPDQLEKVAQQLQDFMGDMNVVGVYIGYLRRKIEQGYAYPLIHTVRGVGYRLSAAGK